MSALVPLTVACLLQAAQLQGVPPSVVLTVLKVEGGKVGMASRNTNGTEDLGPMQVNTGAWLKTVAGIHFNGDKKAAYEALRDNGCYNVHVGTWILRKSIDDADGNIYEGIGFYHSRTTRFKERYQGLFRKNFLMMFGTPSPGKPVENPPAGKSDKVAEK